MIFRPPRALFAVLVALSACTSMGTLQTPDVLERGRVSVLSDLDLNGQRRSADFAPAPIGGGSLRLRLHVGVGRGFEGYLGGGAERSDADAIVGPPGEIGIKAGRRFGRFVSALSLGAYRGFTAEPSLGPGEWKRATRTAHLTLMAGLPLGEAPAEKPRSPFRYAPPAPYAALRLTRLNTAFTQYRYEERVTETFAGWVPSVSLGLRTAGRGSLLTLECSLFYFGGQLYRRGASRSASAGATGRCPDRP